MTKGQQRPMQLSGKKTYSVKDCVNKGTLQQGQTKASSGPFRSSLFLRWFGGVLQGLRVWVGGLGEVVKMRKTVHGCPERERKKGQRVLLGWL